MRRLDTKRMIQAAILSALVCLPGASPAAASQAGTVTGVKGDATGTNGELTQHAALSDDEKVQTGEDGNLALLLGDDVLVELCASSSLVVENEEDGRRILRIEGGEARILVEPGKRGIPIEIHTPAAIATIFGTVIYVTVDPETGETTITSSDHDVEVRGIGPAASEPIQITGGQRTTVAWGGAPEQPEDLVPRRMRDLGQCLGDFESDLRAVSITRARQARERTLVVETAVVDMAVADDLPPVSAAPMQTTLADEIDNEPVDLDSGEPPFDITDIAEPPMFDDRMPPPCAGVPGEQCGFGR
jgi:hypothetical protein